MQSSSGVNGQEYELKRKLETEDSDHGGKRLALEKVTPTHITVTMDCPATAVGAIIGKKGANVIEITKRSGCKIQIDQSDQRDGMPKRVNLTGPPDKLAVAMSLVSALIKDGANALFEGANALLGSDPNGPPVSVPLESETRCLKAKVGEVIGIRGVTIAEIMRRSGCRVHIIQEPPPDGNVLERQVIYNGTLAQMAEAKALVQAVINEGASALGMAPGGVTGR